MLPTLRSQLRLRTLPTVRPGRIPRLGFSERTLYSSPLLASPKLPVDEFRPLEDPVKAVNAEAEVETESAERAQARATGQRIFRIGLWTVAVGTVTTWYLSDVEAGIYDRVVMPFLRRFDPETVHRFSIAMAAWGLVPYDKRQRTDDARLRTTLWGRELRNPIGLAAGYDKHAEAVDAMFDLGFGMVEVGSITPEPQEGNPRPRVFRLEDDRSVINRYGLNSDGYAPPSLRINRRYWRQVVENLQKEPVDDYLLMEPMEQRYRSGLEGRFLGVNLGRNTRRRDTGAADYLVGLRAFGDRADYAVINVSCPNTPDKGSQQRDGKLVGMLKEIVAYRDQIEDFKPRLVVKISPDLTPQELRTVAEAALEANMDGIIVSNTTTQRPATLQSDPAVVTQTGGLSGPPLRDLALSALREVYKVTQGRIPIIGCGGISSGADAILFARAGANAVQIYTAMVYGGPAVPRRIKDEVLELLGDQKWTDIIGKDDS
ncbi:dihydroorotate dehydrogenase [Tieghemiomyces parasiticus]|uniref:Dihydroorotate dehydrogenase (quinone), mitochondrial n=1 Tax=Tieghemiomyces parasiticus TaxID=78921 RepID=A0A9W8A2Q6_9FUNG|nr:dihydroorotate dehydrogenase [Tieghemiomyces parasiticus]